jgi:uncharacterized membrane protein YeaQ/YmgE (transglycosylase-associated protein family)
MAVVAWIILGLVTGILFGRAAQSAGGGFVSTCTLGVSGSVALGALLYWLCEGLDVTNARVGSLAGAMVLAVVALAAHFARSGATVQPAVR